MQHGHGSMDMNEWDNQWNNKENNNDHHNEHNDYNDYNNYDDHNDQGNDMSWLEDMWNMIWPFLEDPDTLCPILGMIGDGWEQGCRQQMHQ